jgi:hypothetical protein
LYRVPLITCPCHPSSLFPLDFVKYLLVLLEQKQPDSCYQLGGGVHGYNFSAHAARSTIFDPASLLKGLSSRDFWLLDFFISCRQISVAVLTYFCAALDPACNKRFSSGSYHFPHTSTGNLEGKKQFSGFLKTKTVRYVLVRYRYLCSYWYHTGK